MLSHRGKVSFISYLSDHSLLLVIAVLLLLGVSINAQKVEIRGIYGNPKPFWDQGMSLSELGVNAAFVHSGAIDEAMVRKLRQQGIKLYAEFATLNGKNYVQDHPEAWAINEKGEKVEAASWFMGVCPTDPGFKNYRQEQLRELLSTYPLDGVWLDYVHWHAQFETPDPILPETCFCDRCINTFSNHAGIQLHGENTQDQAQFILNFHDGSWRDWRCQVILEWVKEMKAVVKELRPQALLGLYHCPWDDDDFEGARRRILGLDYDDLLELVDVFSPMVYHAKMGRAPEWVQKNIEWFSDRLMKASSRRVRIWPIVQAHDDPYKMAASEFEAVMQNGLTGSATGVMMFTSYAVAQDSAKIETMKQLYQSLKNP